MTCDSRLDKAKEINYRKLYFKRERKKKKTEIKYQKKKKRIQHPLELFRYLPRLAVGTYKQVSTLRTPYPKKAFPSTSGSANPQQHVEPLPLVPTDLSSTTTTATDGSTYVRTYQCVGSPAQLFFVAFRPGSAHHPSTHSPRATARRITHEYFVNSSPTPTLFPSSILLPYFFHNKPSFVCFFRFFLQQQRRNQSTPKPT